MELIVRAFPLTDGSGERIRQTAEEMLGERAGAARAFYEHYGIDRETWHLQETPQGTMLLGVTQIANRPLAEAAAEYADSDRSFDRWLKERVKAATSVDLDQQPTGPDTVCILDSAELRGRGARAATEWLVRAALMPGAGLATMRQVAGAIRAERAGEAEEFFDRIGVARETWHHQQTPHGALVIGVTQIEGRTAQEMAADYGPSEEPFDRWLKDQLASATGHDFDNQPAGPASVCIFDTEQLRND